ncbi:phospholipase A2 [Streptomyces erythrochromogenes]|uniref:phospholipase A2 n=1 Tax=Streptomyces erythrochromogenes TaxID=285574 RepID=UPI0036B978E1
MNPTVPTHERTAPRRAVSWWRRFHGAFRMLCLLAVGVVALGVAANAAPAQRQISRGSNPVATIELGQIVAAGQDVYALSADHQGVYLWSSGRENWMKVGGPAKQLYAGGKNVYAVNPTTGDLHKYGSTPGRWDRIGGPGLAFAATHDQLFGISPDGRGVWEYTGKGDTWNKVGGPATNIYARPAQRVSPEANVRSVDNLTFRPYAPLYATDPTTGDLHSYDGMPARWAKVGGPGATFAVTDNNLYGLTPDRSAVVERGKNGTWQKVGGPAGHIFAGNTLYATSPAGDLHKYRGKPGKWDRVSGPAAAFATSGHHLFRLTPDRRSVQKYDGNGSNDRWKNLGGPVRPAGLEQKLERLAALTRPGKESRDAWIEALAAHRQNKPDPYEFNWGNDGCSRSPDMVAGWDFTLACIRHDFGYRNYKHLLGDSSFVNTTRRDSPKNRVDLVLLEELKSICSGWRQFPLPQNDTAARSACYAAADKYYGAVVAFG